MLLWSDLSMTPSLHLLHLPPCCSLHAPILSSLGLFWGLQSHQLHRGALPAMNLERWYQDIMAAGEHQQACPPPLPAKSFSSRRQGQVKPLSLSLTLSLSLSFCFDSAFSLLTSDHLMLCHSAAEWLCVFLQWVIVADFVYTGLWVHFVRYAEIWELLCLCIGYNQYRLFVLYFFTLLIDIPNTGIVLVLA